ncbi:3-keto-5-aminohexanoate cleavage protein [Sphingomonas sp. CFBP8993]|uniref:3-keto-5-aminohexanoate cleavage protein n=1 Tax=Sphingomonas sp. CFBP8993 TaxID=3096526 RepID=UPI002A6B0C2E|nr:3-keto-5-aminohexanoate cleavage protein [Sphingomonas sp. CFBP8993]MDY0960472.1 3-keto-5-aminohexanoate cleavage protein [Sphingomonas sp. CFBP8993]
MTFLQAALNGDRQHDAVPHSPDAIAADAEAVVRAGAHSVHVHAYDAAGRETLNAVECDAVVAAIRRRCPGVPVSLTTSASIVSDPLRRLAMVKEWKVLPDLVTANQGEAGIVELAEYLLSRGVGIEAGLLCPDDAYRFVASALPGRCHRVLIEPLDPDPETASRDAAAMEAILADGGITLPQIHHGFDGSCWAVNLRALERGHGIRTGMEDVVVLPDGQPARDNAHLVISARTLIDGIAKRS